MSSLHLERIPPFKVWKRRKILVLHMETPVLSVEACLKLAKIPFIAMPYNDADIEKDIKDKMEECFGIIITGSRKVKGQLPALPDSVLESKLPKLGLCYGNEILGQHMGAELVRCKNSMGEFSQVSIDLKPSPLFDGYDTSTKAMAKMEHIYMLKSAPEGCRVIASTKQTPVAGFECLSKNIFGIQFHPEKGWFGDIIFKNFYKICDKANTNHNKKK
jgi:GMP synthase-like glutamine amidotransferase